MKILEQYAELKKQEKEISAKLKELQPKVMAEINRVEGKKLITEFGTYSLYARRVWKYSDELITKEKQIKEKIKLLQHEEQINGKAKVEDIPTVKFTEAK